MVLYVESDDGSIFRLSGTMLGETTVRGDTRAWVNATWLYQDDERVYRYDMVIVLASAAERYLVHDIYYSLASDSESG